MKRFEEKLRRWAANMQIAGAEAAWAAAQRGAEIARELAPVDSGELRSSINARRSGGSAQVVSSAAHAALLEYGTSRMAAQPYMLPMAEKMRGEYADLAQAALKEVLV